MSEKLFLETLKGKTSRRPPFWFMRQAGRYLPEYRETRRQAGSFLDLCYTPELAAEVTLQPLRRYHMDAAILFADILLVPDALGQAVAYKEGEGPVLEPLRRIEDLARLSAGGLHDRLAPVYETVRILGRELPADTALIGFAGAPWTVATYMVEGGGSADHAHTKLWAFTDPAGFARLMDLLVEATAEYLCAQIAAGAEAVQIFDTWAGALPESAFRRWSIEPTAAIVDRVRERYPGVPIIGFPRGAGANYAAYVAETGVDGVSLDTAMPLHWAVEALQPKVAVQGNLDPLMVVAGGGAMEAESRRILSALGKGPFVFNLGHGIVPQTPPEHVAALAELIRGWTGGA